MKFIFSFIILLLTSQSLVLADTFRGYYCTSDCSGHLAGYNWAENNDITDKNDCYGNSQSFTEGCFAYVEETQEGHDSEE